MSEFKRDLEDYFCKFTFGQFVTLILLELVTLFFVFYLGARFGPDLIGGRSDLARKESGPPAAFPAIPAEGPSTQEEPQPASGAIRVKPSGLTAAEYEEKVQEMIQERETPMVIPAPERKSPPKSPPVAAATPPEQTVKKPPPEPEEGGRYTVQVGSFQTVREAQEAMNKWKGKGYSSFMTIAEIPDKGTWYRVRIGRFATERDAKSFMEKFRRTEQAEALVVTSRS